MDQNGWHFQRAEFIEAVNDGDSVGTDVSYQ